MWVHVPGRGIGTDPSEYGNTQPSKSGSSLGGVETGSPRKLDGISHLDPWYLVRADHAGKQGTAALPCMAKYREPLKHIGITSAMLGI